MTVRLRPIRREDLPSFCAWREAARPYLRTPFVINLDQQIRWYEDVVCDRRATDRFWAIEASVVETFSETRMASCALAPRVERVLVGIGGLTEIQWPNGLAEISLILDPAAKGKGYGHQAFNAVLSEAFDAMGLYQVIANVYHHNPSLGFWKHMADRWGATAVDHGEVKFWAGKRHDETRFAFKWKELHAKPGDFA
jgi:RimJ/RimL family protein N-acetyltransferase